MSRSERRIEELEDEVRKLRHLLSEQMRTGEELEVTAIVNREGVPKVDLRWDQLGAQVSVESARSLAFDIFRVCEWAETDATMFRLLSKDLGEQSARGFLAMMREARGGQEIRSG